MLRAARPLPLPGFRGRYRRPRFQTWPYARYRLLAAIRSGVPLAGNSELTDAKTRRGIASRCHLPLCQCTNHPG
jgi:hypothetical protein